VYEELEGQVAIVTGGARGIGRAVAARLGKEGCKVVIADINASLADEVARLITKEGNTCISIPTDVSNSISVSDMVSRVVESFGSVDILINNAVVAYRPTLIETSDDQWNTTVATNLGGCFFCTRAVVKRMIQQGKGGKIVNFSSMCATLGLRKRAAYSATKAGIEALTRCSAVELAPYNIRVNAVAPGSIDTESNIPIQGLPHQKEALLNLIPLGQIGSPSQVASVVLFLVSNESSYITGEIIKVDGGWTVSELGIED